MFVYKNWDKFCKKLSSSITCVTANNALLDNSYAYDAIIKHDVETNVPKALKLAEIESKYNIMATYYVQLYLLESEKNIKALKEIQKLGHEVTYHYDVLDANGGDWDKAISEFNYAIKKFEDNGFKIYTVCPHGNPVMKRNGWSSNKDFFRNKDIKEIYCSITDIVIEVNRFGENGVTYISDAGYGWKLISDISNNDRDKTQPDVVLNDLDSVFNLIRRNSKVIISTHPHRWYSSTFNVWLRLIFFKLLRSIVNIMTKFPFFKQILSNFYFLAKKI